MNRITIDLVKLIEQTAPQVFGSVDPRLLRQWLEYNTGAAQPVIIDLAAMTIENETATSAPISPSLRPRIKDVTTFDDNSELRIQVLAPQGSQEDMATDAYYGLLAAMSHI